MFLCFGLCCLRINLRGENEKMKILLLIFFVGFNLLEALQPSLVSRLSGEHKGVALGVYNTIQSLGMAMGGVVGGWLLGHWGAVSVFRTDIVLIAAWLIIAWSMAELPGRRKVVEKA